MRTRAHPLPSTPRCKRRSKRSFLRRTCAERIGSRSWRAVRTACTCAHAGPIVDEDTFDADKLADADTIVSKKAFAGPYTLTAFKINESAAYAKNDSYKGLTPAKNSVVQVKYFADASNLKMAVQQGQVDVAYRSLSPTDIEDQIGRAHV